VIDFKIVERVSDMRRFSCYCPILIGLWTLVSGMPAGAQAPRMSSTQAIQIATSYCKAVGITVTGQPACVLPDHPAGFRTYWQPLWRVSFAGQADVDVADGTGIVTEFRDTALERELGNQPAGTAISEGEAIGIATAALSATGQAGELTYDSAMLTQNGDPPCAVSHTWTVTWQREIQGIPYRDEHATVQLQAETGRLDGLAVIFPSVPLQTASLSLPRDHAVAIATSTLAQAGVSDAAFESVQALIVKTDPSWRSAGAPPPQSVPVWVCSFQRLIGRVVNKTTEVWVDNTGAVVGGLTYELASALPDKTRKPAGPTAKPSSRRHPKARR